MAEIVRVTIVLGTRPEIIKTAPVIRELRDSPIFSLTLVHTNQHYETNMSGAFFETLNLSRPDINLDIGSGSQAEQTASGLVQIEKLVESKEPAVVLAQGDTNAVLSAALATSKLKAKFGHIEAGIRSFDQSMPEEINRVIADRVANYCFAPTSIAVENLADEGIAEGVYQTGNTVVDACLQHRSLADTSSRILQKLNLDPEEYAVATIHRPLNTDTDNRLRTILTALDAQSIPVIFPCHPRTRNAIDRLGFKPTGSLRLIEPLDYLDFLKLEAESRLLVTDSGGIQEEASILEIPCVTVRPNTERPETIESGVNVLVDPLKLRDVVDDLIMNEQRRRAMQGATDLYGDGESGSRIVEFLETKLGP